MELEKKIRQTFEKSILKFDNSLSKNNPNSLLNHINPGIIDLTSLELMEISRLFDAVNNTETTVGATTLMRSLSIPLTDLELIKSKQESVKEIESKSELREKLQELLEYSKGLEQNVYGYFFRSFPVVNQYKVYKNFRNQILGLSEKIKGLESETPYLGFLINDLNAFQNSRSNNLVKGPVYHPFFSKNSVKHRKEMSFFRPATKFTRRSYKIWPAMLGTIPLVSAPQSIFGITMLYLLSTPPFLSYDHKHFIKPLRETYLQNGNFDTLFESIGKIDELMSFIKYKENLDCDVTLPEIVDEDNHSMLLKNARNPTLVKSKGKLLTPHDFTLKEVYLTLITGPNSGGKTTFCKTAVQIQDLGQIGSYIPASFAKISIADKIAYQAPMFDSLTHNEGRFGTELKRTKEIFFTATPKSLIVLDELAQGTTFEEELKHAGYIGKGFHRLKGNTLFVTHNHQLVDKYIKKDMGKASMVEFNGDKPTYKLVDGISRISHADRIAEEIGFSEQDVEEYLVTLGL